MPAGEFVHLRVHTAYSLSEGAIRVKDLAGLCVRHGMPAAAITDTNNLFGGMEFSSALRDKGVQPIIGCQLAVGLGGGSGPRAPAGKAAPAAGRDPVVLLVQNPAGYRNLLRLLAEAYAEAGPDHDPRVSVASLCRHAAGLILLTGGPDGPVGRLLLEGRREAAEQLAAQLRDAFADRLYVELQRHSLEAEEAVEPALLALAAGLALPIVATNDVYYATPEMHEAHDALLCIAEGRHVSDTNRRRLTTEHWFKSADDMRAAFSDLPDAVENTVLIARRCAFTIEQVKPILPPYDCGQGRNEEDALREASRRGLDARLAALGEADRQGREDRVYRERLDYELDVIIRMGFAGYFLIVAEFIGWAKEEGIPVGPGRGSGAGSVVAWALGITDLDPLRFGLLFERFLNPERVSMPDFDIDFCQDRRDEVIRHVYDKYGADRVAQIITFGKLQARAVLRDVGRVMGLPYGQVDRICKLVPNNPANPVTLDGALKAEPQLQAMVAEDETVARLVDLAKRLEGLYRHASTHAAGVVISGRPLEELIPLYRDPRSELLVTGFNMKWVEAAGLVKFDFLGLKTLTVLAQTVRLLRERGIELDLARLPLDDRRTFEMLGKGDTGGVFQLESSGMRDVLRKLKPDTFEDIIAVVALYRPGPMDNIPSYIRRKHGEEEADYLHPTLEGILRETYGIMIYQEQVMQIAQVLCGYSLGGADLLRRAMGKKIKEEMDMQRATFVSGAVGRGVSETKATQIFELVAKFAGYGFNKSHAAAYALIAYQTAYLKANDPLEFFAASMTLDLANSDKLAAFRQELSRLGIRLLPPDVNASEAAFSVEQTAGSPEGGAGGAGAIRYPLEGVKTVGEPAARAIIEERRRNGPFASVADFARRIDPRGLNKRQLENLARAGAFDRLDRSRRRVFESAEAMIRCGNASAVERDGSQMGLFGAGAAQPAPHLQLVAVEDWPAMERLSEELEAVGFYLSAHPLDTYAGRLRRLSVVRFADLLSSGRSGPAVLAGTVISRKERTSSKGTKYAFVQLSDTSGVFEVTVFSELLSADRERLEPGCSLLLHVTATIEGETVRCVAQKVEGLDQAVAKLTESVEICLDSPAPIAGIRAALSEASPGRGQIRLIPWLDDGREVEILLPDRRRLTGALLARLRAIPGVRDLREL